jgi:hypothetical protein
VLDVRIEILNRRQVTVDMRGMAEVRMVTPMPLECQECRLLSDEEARGWRMYRADDPDDPFADPLIASYCPDCAEREFGPLHPVRVHGREAL